MNLMRRWFLYVLLVFGTLFPFSQDLEAKSWKILFGPQPPTLNKRTLPDKFPMEIQKDVQLEGVNPNDPFLFNDFRSDGLWGINGGRLTVTAGSNTMLKLSNQENFSLEGIMNAEGLGGWYILFGWKEGHGYMLYNATLKTSGSPWMFTEFRGSKAIEGTHGEIYQYDWEGDQPLYLTVKDKKVTLTIEKNRIADEIEIPNYSRGDIMIGTYNTRYGPKRVKIKTLRIKELKP